MQRGDMQMLLPVRSWSRVTKSLPKPATKQGWSPRGMGSIVSLPCAPWNELRLTNKPPDDSGVSKLNMHSSWYARI